MSLIGASPSGYMVEYMDFFNSEDMTQDFSVKDGKITVPDVPGHGFEFTEEALKNYRID